MIWDKLRGELIDIIEWTDDSSDTLVYRFERYDNEIKHGAQLVVREGQQAVFINQGKLADVFKPGQYKLETKNLPILSTLLGWKYGFSSPFKAEVYFVSTRQFTDLKWGTKNPIILRDAEFGPVRLRAFGTYAMRIVQSDTFIREIVGTDSHFTTDEITDQLRNIVVSRFADILGESKIPVLDMASNYDELGKFITERIKVEFQNYGLNLTTLLVENISLPAEVEQAMDKRTSMGVIGNLDAFTKFQAAQAMEAASKNPGGGAAEGMGLGIGFAMANQMANTMAPQPGGGQTAGQAPPPVPHEAAAAIFVVAGGQQTGPFNENELEFKIRTGELTPDTLVWQQGMATWSKAGTVPTVSKLFGAAPPPVPPPMPGGDADSQ